MHYVHIVHCAVKMINFSVSEPYFQSQLKLLGYVVCMSINRMVYGRLGDKTFGRQTFGRQIFWDDHLSDTGCRPTFGWQQLAVSATGVETFGWQKWSVTPRTATERGSCKQLQLSVFSCFGTHLSKVHRRSNTDLQTLKRLWSRLARRKPFPEQIFIAANYCRLNVQPVCPNGHPKICRPNVLSPKRL